MASVSKITFYSASATTADKQSQVFSLMPNWTNFVGYLDVDFVSGSSTLDATFQHSADGTNWLTLATATQVTTSDSRQVVQINSATTHVLPYVRIDINVGASSPVYNVTAALYYEDAHR